MRNVGGKSLLGVRQPDDSGARRTESDLSYWSYGYDSLGQVASGKKYWSDTTPAAGQQFEYVFDDIGNRNSTKAGGDQNGANLRSASYYVNNLNQYTNRDVPGYLDIIGVGISSNAVTVNGQTAYRKGEYFRQQLPMDNASAALWTNITVSETGQSSVSGNEFLAKNQESFSYDLDGNLIQDGRWTYGWDAENRLTNMTSLSTGPTSSKVKLDFLYDPQGRRIQKIVSTNTSGIYYPQNTNRFIYDGWNLIAVLSPTSQLQSSFAWGLDLSGSPQGAGGVGGLIEINDAANGVQFAAYDGNGNVAALIKGVDGTPSAQYEYGPFGEVIRVTGPMAKTNPFRFSTKFQDDETDLLYYGYRYYGASTGRWLNRDSIGELGYRRLVGRERFHLHRQEEFNLYRFVRNQPTEKIDRLGLISFWTPCLDPEDWALCATRCKKAAGQWYAGVHSCKQLYLFFCTKVKCTCRTNCKLARSTTDPDYPGVFWCTYSCLAHKPVDQITVTIEYEEGDEWKGCPATMADDAPTYQEP